MHQQRGSGVPDFHANIARKHRHANLLGGRARQRQVYTRKFCQAVCEGLAAQRRPAELGMHIENLMSVEELEAAMPQEATHMATRLSAASGQVI